MTWDDEGFLISKNKYSENSLIVEIFTKNHGKTSGIIFGGTSRKIKNYLQLGNQLHVNYSSKTENKIGNFKIEILKAYTPFFFDNYRSILFINLITYTLFKSFYQKNLFFYFIFFKIIFSKSLSIS